jgi:DNA invertase Pin-like site-specific DNA recombinase
MTRNAGQEESTDLVVAGTRPPQVRPVHLTKWAIVYARQSSPVQVREHTGSTADQRALADLARQWGWPATRIRVIDDDLGLSGTSSQDRAGFRSMLEAIDRREVGIVFVRDVSRISRDPFDSEMFLTKAMRAGVLLYASSQLFDTATEDLAQLFGLRIQALLAWFDNRSRVRTMGAARAAKARQGHAVTRPPIGYVQTVRGKWNKDPDPKVQDAVQRLFDLYQSLGSIGNVLRYMRRNALLFPHRRRGEIVWPPPVRSHVAQILRNPAYTGDYVFRHPWTPGLTKTRWRRIPSPSGSESITVPAHHEPYINHQEWQAIQASLTSRRPTVRPPVGRGPALLQGLLWCARCQRWMQTVYHDREGTKRAPRYTCWLVDHAEKHLHSLSCSARLVDPQVVTHVLKALHPLGLKAALRAIEEHQLEQTTVTKARARLLQQAEDDVAEARHRYRVVDPQHARVKVDLEARLEDALEHLDTLKRQIGDTLPAVPARLTTEDAAELVSLATHIEELWSAPTTTNEDRKRLLRTVISRVLVREGTEDVLELDIVWVGGLTERFRVLRYGGINELVRALWKTGKDAQTIIDELSARGVTSHLGEAFTKNAVQVRLRQHGLTRRADRGKVLALIRSLLLEGRSRPQILEYVRREAPARSGPWTSSRLAYVISDLRRGVAGIEPLPAILPADPAQQAVMDLIRQRRAEGQTYKAIANELNSRGSRPPKATSFSAQQVFALLRDPNRRRTKRPRANGGRGRPTGDGSGDQ